MPIIIIVASCYEVHKKRHKNANRSEKISKKLSFHFECIYERLFLNLSKMSVMYREL